MTFFGLTRKRAPAADDVDIEHADAIQRAHDTKDHNRDRLTVLLGEERRSRTERDGDDVSL